MTKLQGPTVQYDTAAILGGLYGLGIIGLKAAFKRDWVEQLNQDVTTLSAFALQRPDGADGRGPKRHHVEIQRILILGKK